MMDSVRQLNGCDPQGQAWGKAGPLTGTLYPSKTGTPFVSLVYPGTHKFPPEAPALIVRFFKENPAK
jgi:polyhydroxybutyrate depolymerase